MPQRAENVQNQRGRPHLIGPATECLLSFKENVHVKKNKHFATEDLFVRLGGIEAAHINKLRKKFGFVIEKDQFHQCHEIIQSPLTVFCIFSPFVIG